MKREITKEEFRSYVERHKPKPPLTVAKLEAFRSILEGKLSKKVIDMAIEAVKNAGSKEEEAEPKGMSTLRDLVQRASK